MEEEMMSECFSWEDTYFELELGHHSYSHSHYPYHDVDDHEFEFRVSISAHVPFPGFHPTTCTRTTISSPNHHHHEATPILDLDILTPILPQMIPTRKRVVGVAGKMVMKLVVKVRSIISIRGVVGGWMSRLFGSNNSRHEAEVGQGCQTMIEFQKRNKLFGIISGSGWRRRSKYTTTTTAQWPTTFPNSILIPSSPSPPQPHHTSSLLHAAIAHCNQTNHFSFQL